MCGIVAIVNKTGIQSSALIAANEIVAHRGPDDEGYLVWKPGQTIDVKAGRDTAQATLSTFRYPAIVPDNKDWKVGFGHRRLSILDVSAAGHQPMVLPSHGLVITYNGEIYNYIEVRQELISRGHQFHTGSDTEVILHAWAEWGVDALHRFNGMFAFVLLDTKRQHLFAVRDRFGVKPLYYSDRNECLAFSSEVKQLCTLPGYSFRMNKQIAYDYLSQSLLDHDSATFEEGIFQLKPGHYISVDLSTNRWSETQWYNLVPKPWEGTEQEACDRFYSLLKDSVKLRMRSDVPVGSALSGGLDSSTIVSLMREVVEDAGNGQHAIKTITSCHHNKKYDEWEYAEEIVKHTRATSFRVFPTFAKLTNDLDKMIWHMDYPFSSTSQFSQWCVFEEAGKQGLTVMIDGQGADEQLAGYGGNTMALYTGLAHKGHWGEWFSEAKNYKNRKGVWPYGFLLGSLQSAFPVLRAVVPARYKSEGVRLPDWVIKNGFADRAYSFRSLQEHLVNQVSKLPLPSLLRYEDRNSMAFSVESRVPFMDYRLMEFTLGLSERLVYHHGERKYILRHALRGHVPNKILDRQDKMGFVSAEEQWLKEEGREWFGAQLEQAVTGVGEFVLNQKVLSMIAKMQNAKIPFNFDPWRILCFNRWYTLKSGQ